MICIKMYQSWQEDVLGIKKEVEETQICSKKKIGQTNGNNDFTFQTNGNTVLKFQTNGNSLEIANL